MHRRNSTKNDTVQTQKQQEVMTTVRGNWPSCRSWWLHHVCASQCHNPAVQLSTHNVFCSPVDDMNYQVMTAVPALCQISVNTTTVW